METRPDDIHTTREFHVEKALLKRIPLLIGILALGAFVLWIADPDDSSDFKTMVAGVGCVLIGVVGIGAVLYRQGNPGPPPLVLSPEGIHYQVTSKKRVLIPWDVIEGVYSISFSRFEQFGIIGFSKPMYVQYVDLTVALVSEAFYEANIHIDSALQRGLLWDHKFIPADDGMQIAFDHDEYAVQAADMRAAVESRWRAFSTHPNAKLPPRPDTDDLLIPPGLRGAWRAITSPAAQRWTLAALIVLAFPVAYYWSYLWARWSYPDFNDPMRAYYVSDLLSKTGLSARLPDGSVRPVRHDDVAAIGSSRCTQELARDTSDKSRWLPAYNAAAYCTVDMTGKSGEQIQGVFKVAVVASEYTQRSYDGKETKVQTSAWMASPLPAFEVNRRLCGADKCPPSVPAGGK